MRKLLKENTNIYYLLILFSLSALCACSDSNEDLNRNETPDTSYSLRNLIEACSQNKVISEAYYSDNSSNKSWKLIFSDGTELLLDNHTEGSYPYIRINSEGFWTVSYQRDRTSFLLNSNEEKILAKPSDINNIESGETLSVRVRVDNNGEYTYEIFNTENPSFSLETIYTEVPVDPDIMIASVVRDDYRGEITFGTSKGQNYTFKLTEVSPYYFNIINEGSLIFNEIGEERKIEFKVIPEDTNFNFDVSSLNCEVRLVYKNGTDAINYSSYPVVITEIQKSAEKKGLYTLTLSDAGDNIYTYNEEVYLTLTYTNGDKERVTITSDIFNVKYDSESPLIVQSEIPIIKITTPSAITSKDNWTENCEIEIINAGDYSKTYSKVQMKGRGNSTWQFSKKPYTIKLDKKEEFLGFPKHKRWVLLANWYDHSNLRSEITFYMGRMSQHISEPGLEYTPRIAYSRVFVNEKFQGLYQVTEQLKIDENRVNVGDNGFLMEVDFRAKEDPENVYFSIPHIDYPIVVKDPDIESQSELDYIKDFMKKVDTALFALNYKDPDKGYKQYIDMESFVDWYLINEITKNADSNLYTSCYMNLKRGEKLKMGPLWDYDLSIGNYADFGDYYYTQWVNEPKDFHIKNTKWFERLFSDPEFLKMVKERFQYFYDHQTDIYDEIDRQKEFISGVIHENEKIWHFFSRQYNADMTDSMFEIECEKIKTWLTQRFSWLKSEFDRM